MLAKACCFALALLLTTLTAAGQTGKFEIVKVAEGVYVAMRTDPLAIPVDGNSIIIVNDNDVVVVDANLLSSSSRMVLAEIRKLTNKPVRYVVNTLA